jgi:hypothetical protein
MHIGINYQFYILFYFNNAALDEATTPLQPIKYGYYFYVYRRRRRVLLRLFRIFDLLGFVRVFRYFRIFWPPVWVGNFFSANKLSTILALDAFLLLKCF